MSIFIALTTLLNNFKYACNEFIVEWHYQAGVTAMLDLLDMGISKDKIIKQLAININKPESVIKNSLETAIKNDKDGTSMVYRNPFKRFIIMILVFLDDLKTGELSEGDLLALMMAHLKVKVSDIVVIDSLDDSAAEWVVLHKSCKILLIRDRISLVAYETLQNSGICFMDHIGNNDCKPAIIKALKLYACKQRGYVSFKPEDE